MTQVPHTFRTPQGANAEAFPGGTQQPHAPTELINFPSPHQRNYRCHLPKKQVLNTEISSASDTGLQMGCISAWHSGAAGWRRQTLHGEEQFLLKHTALKEAAKRSCFSQPETVWVAFIEYS